MTTAHEELRMRPTKYRPLPIRDGDAVLVDPDLYPTLMEWEWRYDAGLDQVVREDAGGQPVYLYYEQLRWYAEHADSGHDVPALTRTAVRKLFAGSADYVTLLRLSRLQRDVVLSVCGCVWPSAVDLLTAALSGTLLTYFRRPRDGRWVVDADATGMTPGRLVQVSSDVLPAYPTLGAWMATECTGDWVAGADTPTGLRAQTYADALQGDLRVTWRAIVLDENEGAVPFKPITRALVREQCPLTRTLGLALKLVGARPVP
jgi:hypothetical protein